MPRSQPSIKKHVHISPTFPLLSSKEGRLEALAKYPQAKICGPTTELWIMRFIFPDSLRSAALPPTKRSEKGFVNSALSSPPHARTGTASSCPDSYLQSKRPDEHSDCHLKSCSATSAAASGFIPSGESLARIKADAFQGVASLRAHAGTSLLGLDFINCCTYAFQESGAVHGNTESQSEINQKCCSRPLLAPSCVGASVGGLDQSDFRNGWQLLLPSFQWREPASRPNKTKLQRFAAWLFDLPARFFIIFLHCSICPFRRFDIQTISFSI